MAGAVMPLWVGRLVSRGARDAGGCCRCRQEDSCHLSENGRCREWQVAWVAGGVGGKAVARQEATASGRDVPSGRDAASGRWHQRLVPSWAAVEIGMTTGVVSGIGRQRHRGTCRDAVVPLSVIPSAAEGPRLKRASRNEFGHRRGRPARGPSAPLGMTESGRNKRRSVTFHCGTCRYAIFAACSRVTACSNGSPRT